MIFKKINKIKNFGIFQNFKWDSSTPEFQKHNIFYGWNYSGKSTISRIFACFENNQKHLDFPNAEFEWNKRVRLNPPILRVHKKLRRQTLHRHLVIYESEFLKDGI